MQNTHSVWIPEQSNEYGFFKFVTQENKKLIEILSKHILLSPSDRVLDVGGRDGNISFTLQSPEMVDIIDPDPTIEPLHTPREFRRKKLQDVEFGESDYYKLIICCHVLGYLGLQSTSQESCLHKLTDRLAEDGTLVLFYNTNTGYMGELLEYSKHVLPMWHYDFFDEKLLATYRSHQFEVKKMEVSFPLYTDSMYELARCCWFLFGAMVDDIDGVAKKFEMKLQNDLIEPCFPVHQNVVFITKKSQALKIPTLR